MLHFTGKASPGPQCANIDYLVYVSMGEKFCSLFEDILILKYFGSLWNPYDRNSLKMVRKNLLEVI